MSRSNTIRSVTDDLHRPAARRAARHRAAQHDLRRGRERAWTASPTPPGGRVARRDRRPPAARRLPGRAPRRRADELRGAQERRAHGAPRRSRGRARGCGGARRDQRASARAPWSPAVAADGRRERSRSAPTTTARRSPQVVLAAFARDAIELLTGAAARRAARLRRAGLRAHVPARSPAPRVVLERVRQRARQARHYRARAEAAEPSVTWR